MVETPKINVIYEVHQKIYTEQVLRLKMTCSYVILHLYLKRLGFTGEPVT